MTVFEENACALSVGENAAERARLPQAYGSLVCTLQYPKNFFERAVQNQLPLIQNWAHGRIRTQGPPGVNLPYAMQKFRALPESRRNGQVHLQAAAVYGFVGLHLANYRIPWQMRQSRPIPEGAGGRGGQ